MESRVPLSRAAIPAAALVLLSVATAWAQPPVPSKLIGVLSPVSKASPYHCLDELRKGLARNGWLESQNYAIQIRHADFDEALLPERARELAALRPDVMVSSGVAPIVALRAASSTIPIVTFGSGQLVTLGLAKSLAHSGTNITGFSNGEGEHGLKPFEVLAQVLPSAKRIGVIFNERNPAHPTMLKKARQLAEQMGREIIPVWFSGRETIDQAWKSLAERKVDAVVVMADLGIYVRGHVKEAQRLRLPAIGVHRAFARLGGLMSYGQDRRAAVRCEDAARYIDQIFRGRNPAELPIEESTELELTINLKAARTLGIRIEPEMAARAAALIE